DALDVDDPAKAVAQLQELGRQKWPSASEAEQFARAVDDPANAKLAAKAHRRLSATTVYPFPEGCEIRDTLSLKVDALRKYPCEAAPTQIAWRELVKAESGRVGGIPPWPALRAK